MSMFANNALLGGGGRVKVCAMAVHKLLLEWMSKNSECGFFTEELDNVHAMQVCGSWSMRCNYELVFCFVIYRVGMVSD